ncbi:hypothetical protein HAX54_002576, partial [Datura stramonium]|nr:hypothetical protein [Datura stramonium]
DFKAQLACHGRDQNKGINVGTLSLSHLIKENQDYDQMMVAMATKIVLLTKTLTEAK